MTIALPLAHGIGGVREPPLPLWLFYYGGASVLVVSFRALGVLWRTPLLQENHGRPLPTLFQRVLLAPATRVALRLGSVFLFWIVFLAALFGEPSAGLNVAPTFVWVVFWLGLVPLVVLFGNVWAVLSPWRAIADATAWWSERARLSWEGPFAYPERLGRWPAAVLLFAFASLELAHPDPSSPRVLAAAIAVYSWITWLGMLSFGRRAWLENGEAFNVYFGFLGRLAPFAVRNDDGERTVVARRPLAGLAGASHRPGTVAFVAVMLGSVAFDGFSRTPFWLDDVVPSGSELAAFAVNVGGLVLATIAVALLFRAAAVGARLVARETRRLDDAFVMSLVPIALGYLVAHYFFLFLVQGQLAIPLASDPFGYGWDLFGTAGHRVDIEPISPDAVWYIQVGALVGGHVLGLALAHESAIALLRSTRTALRSQYAMLVLMVAYTVGGLWLLSTG